jgi:hypothetical protein
VASAVAALAPDSNAHVTSAFQFAKEVTAVALVTVANVMTVATSVPATDAKRPLVSSVPATAAKPVIPVSDKSISVATPGFFTFTCPVCGVNVSLYEDNSLSQSANARAKWRKRAFNKHANEAHPELVEFHSDITGTVSTKSGSVSGLLRFALKYGFTLVEEPAALTFTDNWHSMVIGLAACIGSGYVFANLEHRTFFRGKNLAESHSRFMVVDAALSTLVALLSCLQENQESPAWSVANCFERMNAVKLFCTEEDGHHRQSMILNNPPCPPNCEPDVSNQVGRWKRRSYGTTPIRSKKNKVEAGRPHVAKFTVLAIVSECLHNAHLILRQDNNLDVGGNWYRMTVALSACIGAAMLMMVHRKKSLFDIANRSGCHLGMEEKNKIHLDGMTYLRCLLVTIQRASGSQAWEVATTQQRLDAFAAFFDRDDNAHRSQGMIVNFTTVPVPGNNQGKPAGC